MSFGNEREFIAFQEEKERKRNERRGIANRKKEVAQTKLNDSSGGKIIATRQS